MLGRPGRRFSQSWDTSQVFVCIFVCLSLWGLPKSQVPLIFCLKLTGFVPHISGFFPNVTNCITGSHTFPTFSLFKKCEHGELEADRDKPWMKEGEHIIQQIDTSISVYSVYPPPPWILKQGGLGSSCNNSGHPKGLSGKICAREVTRVIRLGLE